MNRTQLAQSIIWLDQIVTCAMEAKARLKSELNADAAAEFEQHGTAPTWRLPDVATIAAGVSHPAAVVVDEVAFAKWVIARFPEQTQTIVRPAFRAQLLAGVTSDPPCMPDGEVIPGVAWTAGGKFMGVSIRATAAAKEAFAAVAGHALRRMAAEAGPNVPVVLAELDQRPATPSMQETKGEQS